ncbi:MAG: chemotaxis protein CheW [Anaerolineae bacterium]
MSERERDLLAINETYDVENMYLTFDVQDEEYAVNIGYVTEIVGLQKISEVPDVPEFIKGVINLRGKVIPVMDMRLRFGLDWREYGDRTTIIVLELDDPSTLDGTSASGQMTLTGLVVDQVTDVLSMAPESIAPPPRWHGASRQRGEDDQEGTVIQGLGKRDDAESGDSGVSIILDVPRLLVDQGVRLDLPQEAAVAAEEAATAGETETQ